MSSIPTTPELLSTPSSGSLPDDCSFPSALSAGSLLEVDFNMDAAAPLPEEITEFDVDPGPHKDTPSLDILLRDLPPSAMGIVNSKLTTSPMSAISVASDTSQVPLLDSQPLSINTSRGVIRRTSDKGPTSTAERGRGVSMLSLPSTPFLRQDVSHDPKNSLRPRTIKFISPHSVGTFSTTYL